MWNFVVACKRDMVVGTRQNAGQQFVHCQCPICSVECERASVCKNLLVQVTMAMAMALQKGNTNNNNNVRFLLVSVLPGSAALAVVAVFGQKRNPRRMDRFARQSTTSCCCCCLFSSFNSNDDDYLRPAPIDRIESIMTKLVGMRGWPLSPLCTLENVSPSDYGRRKHRFLRPGLAWSPPRWILCYVKPLFVDA